MSDSPVGWIGRLSLLIFIGLTLLSCLLLAVFSTPVVVAAFLGGGVQLVLGFAFGVQWFRKPKGAYTPKNMMRRFVWAEITKIGLAILFFMLAIVGGVQFLPFLIAFIGVQMVFTFSFMKAVTQIKNSV